MQPNELAQWLALADKQNLYGAAYRDSASSYDPSGQRLLWATEMARGNGAGGHSSDFFGDDPPNALMEYAPREHSMRPMRQPVDDPLRPQIRNYIARMLGGR